MHSGAELEAKILQMALCHYSGIFLGAVKSPHIRKDGVSSGHYHHGARKKNLGHESVARSAARVCGRTFEFGEKS